MVKKTLIPTDLRDFLSIFSFIGAVAIFFEFALNNPLLSEKMTPLFLIILGSGLLLIGKVFQIKEWLRDGLQQNETLQVIALVFGLSSMIIGFMLLFNLSLPESIKGFVGFLALVPAAFIFFDYLVKNTRRC